MKFFLKYLKKKKKENRKGRPWCTISDMAHHRPPFYLISPSEAFSSFTSSSFSSFSFSLVTLFLSFLLYQPHFSLALNFILLTHLANHHHTVYLRHLHHRGTSPFGVFSLSVSLSHQFLPLSISGCSAFRWPG